LSYLTSIKETQTRGSINHIKVMSKKYKTKKQLLNFLNDGFEEVEIELKKLNEKTPFTEKMENSISYKYGQLMIHYLSTQQMIKWVEDLEEIK